MGFLSLIVLCCVAILLLILLFQVLHKRYSVQCEYCELEREATDEDFANVEEPTVFEADSDSDEDISDADEID